MESQVKFWGTQNISLASQQNSITAFSLTTKWMGTENNCEKQYNKMPPNSSTSVIQVYGNPGPKLTWKCVTPCWKQKKKKIFTVAVKLKVLACTLSEVGAWAQTCAKRVNKDLGTRDLESTWWAEWSNLNFFVVVFLFFDILKEVPIYLSCRGHFVDNFTRLSVCTGVRVKWLNFVFLGEPIL